MRANTIAAAGALLATILGSMAAQAGDAAPAENKGSWDSWHNLSTQFAYSWDSGNDFILGYGSPSGERKQFRTEFQNIWKYGENYIYFDVLNSDQPFGGAFGDGPDTTEFYGLINSNISLQKVLGYQRGLVDVALEARAEAGTFFDYHAYAFGASLYLNLPGFVEKPGDKIQFTWWHRWNEDQFSSFACFGGPPCVAPFSETRYADHNLFGLTIRKEWEMFNMRWQHQTFLRYQMAESGSPDEVQRFDRIFWESEIFAYLTNNLSVGFRSEYFRDEGGIDFGGVKEHWRPMVAVKWDLSRSD